MLATFARTVVVDLTVAIAVGMVLAAFLFMKRMAETSKVEAITADLRDEGIGNEEARSARHAGVPRDVQVYDVNGPFFVGAAESFRDALWQVHWKPRALIFDMEDAPVIDSTGLRALTEVVRQSQREGIRVVLCDLQPQPRGAITGSGLGDALAADGLELDFGGALALVGGTGEHPGPRAASAG